MAAENGETKWLSGNAAKDGARDLFSGMAAGFVCKLVEYPFDTLKVLMQTNARYSGPWDCVKTVTAESGFLAFYNGLASPLIGSMGECAALFVSYGQLQHLFRVDPEEVRPLY